MIEDDVDVMALRCYVQHEQEGNASDDALSDGHDDSRDDDIIHYSDNEEITANDSVVLVLDTETAVDETQSLRFGSCGIWVNGRLWKFYVFHADDLPEGEVAIIKDVARTIKANVLSKKEFVEQVFFKQAYFGRAKVVGFNLKFDLSRLAISFGKARARSFQNGFSLKLSEYHVYPRIRVRSLNTKAAFVEFAPPLASRRSERKRQGHFRGCFIDLRTVAFALTNESYNLDGALRAFGCGLNKLDVTLHGRLTPQYVRYNIEDVLATYELHTKVVERWQHYHLDKGLNQLYSPASVGKAYFDKMGIVPFLDGNPTFSAEVLGYLMSSYYGGRTEARIRKEPVKVTYIDFASMYPSIYALSSMDDLLKAEKIVYSDTTKQTRKWLAKVTLADIAKKEMWANLLTICKVRPKDDILPFRSLYGEKSVYNIGLNYVKTVDDNMVWYTLADMVASKPLTGKAPEIVEAIKFRPSARQQDLHAISIVGGISVSPKDDFIQRLIRERIRVKREAKSLTGFRRKEAEQLQTDLKIVANSTSYGVFIELNSEDGKDAVSVHSNVSFSSIVEKIETKGRAFNPVMAPFITAGARLILAAAEALLPKNGGYLAYCDTDGMFVSPPHAKLVQGFFKPLDPFGIGGDVFKIEDDELGRPLNDVQLYAISSKRYVLYDRNQTTGRIEIRKYSSHGIGHLYGINERLWWQNVLLHHYHPEDEGKVLEKYAGMFAISRLTINDYQTFSRFKIYNEHRPLNKQVKPFNFVTVGVGYQKDSETGKPIIPLLPFVDPKSGRFSDIPYTPFADYKTGKHYSKNTEFFWQPLSEAFENFIDHPESKFDGNIGVLQRKHVKFNRRSIRHIGKESNQIEESEVVGVDSDSYTHYVADADGVFLQYKDLIMRLASKDVAPFGIMREVLANIKRHLRQGSSYKLKGKTKKKLLKVIETRMRA